MGRRRSEVLAAGWRERLRRHATSGLTVVEFCKREGVSIPSFYQWRRRLRGSRDSKSEHASDRGSAFVPIRVSSASVVVVQFPNGIQVRVPADESRALRNVLRAGSAIVQKESPC